MKKVYEWLTDAVGAVERTKTGEQAFRALRIAAVAVVASVATGNPLSGALVAGAVEAAFRQVFPVRV